MRIRGDSPSNRALECGSGVLGKPEAELDTMIGTKTAKQIEVKAIAKQCDVCAIADVAQLLGWVCPLCVNLVEDQSGQRWIHAGPLYPEREGWAVVEASELERAPVLLGVE